MTPACKWPFRMDNLKDFAKQFKRLGRPFTIDMASAYHHVEIALHHRTLLGHEDPCPPRPLAPRPLRPTPASPRHAHLGPMALPKGNQQPDPKPLPLLKPLQKTAEQKNMMR